MELLNRIKAIIGVSDDSKDVVLNELLINQTQSILVYIGVALLPIELEFIVIDTTIARFNRLGSEGLKSENIDVIGMSFQEDLLEPYISLLDKYIQSNATAGNTNKPKIRML